MSIRFYDRDGIEQTVSDEQRADILARFEDIFARFRVSPLVFGTPAGRWVVRCE